MELEKTDTTITPIENEKLKNKMIKGVHSDTWKRLKAIAAIDDNSIAETIRKIVEYYIQQRGIK